jgi:deoxyadenosine/deoxycytidine kinase
MNKRVLIVVAGPPCTGKTTLAEKIAGKYNLLLLYKDGIKETLMDSLGAENREESRQIGIATIRYCTICSSPSCVPVVPW